MSKKTDTAATDAQESTTTKRFESKYNPSLLRECIFSGMDAADIMARLEVKHRQTLKQYVLKLMSDDRTFYEVKGLYLKNSRRPRVNNKLELKLYLKSIDLQGFEVNEGDEFAIMVEGQKIILTKI